MNKKLGFLISILLLVSATAVFAGGPLLIFDPATRTPFKYPVGVVSVYTDLGSNGILTGPESDALTAAGFAEWTAVPTSYLSAAVAGDFSAVGLPDIDGFNAGLVIGADNGGGIHVMYDDDSSIVSFFFGAPPGVLGIASPDFAIGGTLTESWAVVNGTAADPGDIGGASFGGVFTHEFGHAINLAHTQTTGAVGFFGDDIGPDACATPYGGPVLFSHFETMYPFLDPSAGSVGIDQATVDLLDDIAAVSNVYATGGWPGAFATIDGIVYAPDGTTEVTGINVIARNVADPFGDCISALSGDYTQGALGPDGLFTFNGLTPGADYVVYIDEIVAGGFSTSPTSIPGDGNEEYWNAAEDADPGIDDPCAFTTISGGAGSTTTADIIVNGDPNNLGLGDDDFAEVALPFGFSFCGVTYSSVFVGSNGFLTFGQGDTDFSASVSDFLNNEPRIAALWDDLNPDQGGSITAMASGADFVVSYNNVPEFFATGANSFTITLHSDGTYDIDYVSLTSDDGLVGRTPGGGVPDPGETDLDVEPQPIGTGVATVYEFFSLNDNDLDGLSLAWGTCVIPDPPAIAVDPTSMSAKLVVDDMETQTLTISNLGDLDLDWTILSDQLFGQIPGPGSPGVIENDIQGPIAEPNIDSEVTLARYNADISATPVGHKPEESQYAVPLPHYFALNLLSEDFNSGFPAGWSAIDNEASGVVFQVPQQLEGNYTGGSGDACGASSDAFGPAPFDTELRTPAISGFGTNVVLTYKVNYQNFAAFDFFDVDVSTDGGTNWTNVLSWNEDHGSFFGAPGEVVALNLDAFVQGNPDFIVRWRYYDPNAGNDWDWYVMVDDVSIVSDEMLTPCSFLTVAPDAGTISGDGSVDVDVTFDATGFAPGTYDCELIIFSNAVNTDRLVVPVQMVVAHPALVDVMPEKCPNVIQTGMGGGEGAMGNRATIKVALAGTDDLDLNDVDLSSLTLAGVPVARVTVRDHYDPACENGHGQCAACTYGGVDYSGSCECLCNGKDGHKDADLRFNRDDVLEALGDGASGLFSVTLAGDMNDGTCLLGSDCVLLVSDPIAREMPGGGEEPTPEGVASLGDAVPNPFNPSTRINYSVPNETNVTLSVYDVSGRLISRLVSGVRSAGDHSVEWKADGLASGIYFYRLEMGNFVKTKKMILLK